MTDKPTPHRPMSRADWDATNEHARRVLHPEPDDTNPITESVERLALMLNASGGAQVVSLPAKDVRLVLRALTDARTESARLRERATLTDKDDAVIRSTLDIISDYKQMLRDSPAHGPQGKKAVEYEYQRDLLVEAAFRLMDILSRLTSHDPRPDGDA